MLSWSVSYWKNCNDMTKEREMVQKRRKKSIGNPRMKAAMAYAKRGWPVLPLHGICDGNCTCSKAKCASPGKHPRTPKGFKDATTDAEQVRKWWRQSPDANVGIATGIELAELADMGGVLDYLGLRLTPTDFRHGDGSILVHPWQRALTRRDPTFLLTWPGANWTPVGASHLVPPPQC